MNRFMRGHANADIVISGSSRALVHYDPTVISNHTGFSAFNIGRNGSDTHLQLTALRAYLRHNAKPRLVIQNLDIHSLAKGELYDVTAFVPYLDDPFIYEGFHSRNPDVWKWRVIPLYAYVVEDMHFTWLRGIGGNFGLHPREDFINGFNPRYRSWNRDFENFKERVPNGTLAAIEPFGLNALESIINLCREREIPLILVYSPEYFEAQQLTRNRREIIEKFQKFADQYGVSFWDFSDSPLCRDTEYFYNSQHLNQKGAKQFSDALANRLSQPNGGRQGSILGGRLGN